MVKKWLKAFWKWLFPEGTGGASFQISAKGMERVDPHKDDGLAAKDLNMANQAFKIKQTAVGSEQVLAPLNTKMSQVENVFGPACIVNESDHEVRLRNDLLYIVLDPGERHILEGPPLRRWYDENARTNAIEKWDPLNTLQDLICEYERSQDAVVRYNWGKAALLECSQLKAFRVRGGEL